MDLKTVTRKPVDDSSTPLILVVDDNEDNRILLEYTISMFGWRAIAAIDAVHALAKAKKHQPDIILLDIVMPEIDGFQIANMLKSSQHTKNIPLIAVTGLVSSRDKTAISAYGFNAYLSKPFILHDLKRIIIANLNANIQL